MHDGRQVSVAVSPEAEAALERDSCAAAFAEGCAEGRFDLVLPGGGRTIERFASLRALGRLDLAVARLAEGHADALAILAEAHAPVPVGSRLGVWAAGPLEELAAAPEGAGWRLRGVRRWCSGANCLSHALVTAASPEGPRLFLVPMNATGIVPDPTSWPAVGMAGSTTLDVTFDDVSLDPAAAIGEPGFYLSRPGFWVGGAGVAAVWLGGADAIAETLRLRSGSGPHALAHLGAVHARLAALSCLLYRTAADIDELLAVPDPDRGALELAARSLRAEVEAGASEVLDRTGRATGAGPLGHDGPHARRVADLTVYLRQSHAERDLEALGSLVRERSSNSKEPAP